MKSTSSPLRERPGGAHRTKRHRPRSARGDLGEGRGGGGALGEAGLDGAEVLLDAAAGPVDVDVLGEEDVDACVVQEVRGLRFPVTEGGSVSGIDDCAKGNMCWNVNDKNEGICVALCKGTPDAPVCELGFSCAFSGEVLNLCLPGCDPLLQDCAGDKLCVPNHVTFVCVPDASGDMGKTNDPCEFVDACDKGLVCLNASSATSACLIDAGGCCQPVCDLTAMETCPNFDQECVQWFDPMMPIPPGNEDVGVCAIPQ